MPIVGGSSREKSLGLSASAGKGETNKNGKSDHTLSVLNATGLLIFPRKTPPGGLVAKKGERGYTHFGKGERG